jgi:HTH-type transcriptional regulator/antitoxin HigA
MRIRPVRNDADHREAMAEIERLWGAPEGSPQADQLEVLVTLVNAYETEHHRIEAPDPIAAIEFRMEQQGLTRKDLEPLIGGRGRVSEILSGQRPLTLAMIRRLHQSLGIPADVLLGEEPSRITRSRRKAGPRAAYRVERV